VVKNSDYFGSSVIMPLYLILCMKCVTPSTLHMYFL